MTTALLLICYAACVVGSLYLIHRSNADGSVSLLEALGAAVCGWFLPIGLAVWGVIKFVDYAAATKLWKPKNRNRSQRMVWWED